MSKPIDYINAALFALAILAVPVLAVLHSTVWDDTNVSTSAPVVDGYPVGSTLYVCDGTIFDEDYRALEGVTTLHNNVFKLRADGLLQDTGRLSPEC